MCGFVTGGGKKRSAMAYRNGYLARALDTTLMLYWLTLKVGDVRPRFEAFVDDDICCSTVLGVFGAWYPGLETVSTALAPGSENRRLARSDGWDCLRRASNKQQHWGQHKYTKRKKTKTNYNGSTHARTRIVSFLPIPIAG